MRPINSGDNEKTGVVLNRHKTEDSQEDSVPLVLSPSIHIRKEVMCLDLR